MVASSRRVGLPSNMCDVIPDPWPMTAAALACGACAIAISGSRTWVDTSSLSDCRVKRRAGDEKEFQAEDREKHQPSQLNADNRAGGVRRVDLTDRGFSVVAVENARDQRQRHARAKRRRQHDDETNRVARDCEPHVSRRSFWEDADQRRDP